MYKNNTIIVELYKLIIVNVQNETLKPKIFTLFTKEFGHIYGKIVINKIRLLMASLGTGEEYDEWLISI